MRLFAGAWMFMLLSTISACQQVKKVDYESKNVGAARVTRSAEAPDVLAGTDNTSPSFIKKTEMANAAFLKDAQARHVDVNKTIELLKNGDYVAVDIIYEELHDAYVDNVDNESSLSNAYNIILEKNGFDMKLLDGWVAATGSFSAYAARGVFKRNQGFLARGGRYISGTPEDKIEKMKEYFKEAERDCLTAIRMKPTLMPAYDELITMAKATKMSLSPKEILVMAEKVDKRSLEVRRSYMYSLTPRWGGSYDEMKAFAKYLVQYSDLNPRLWSLQGAPYAEMGFSASLEDDYERAAEFYSQSLVFGEYPAWLQNLARYYLLLSKTQEAKVAYKKLLKYYPDDMVAKIYSDDDWSKHFDVEVKIDGSVAPDIHKYGIKSYALDMILFKKVVKKMTKTMKNTEIRHGAKLEGVLTGLGFKFDANERDHDKKMRADAILRIDILEQDENTDTGTAREYIKIYATTPDNKNTPVWSYTVMGSKQNISKNTDDELNYNDIENSIFEALGGELAKNKHRLN